MLSSILFGTGSLVLMVLLYLIFFKNYWIYITYKDQFGTVFAKRCLNTGSYRTCTELEYRCNQPYNYESERSYVKRWQLY